MPVSFFVVAFDFDLFDLPLFDFAVEVDAFLLFIFEFSFSDFSLLLSLITNLASDLQTMHPSDFVMSNPADLRQEV